MFEDEAFHVNSTVTTNFCFTQTIPAAPNAPPPPPSQAMTGHFPTLQPRGWGISKFCAAQGSGICQPPTTRQPPRLRHSRSFQSEYNYTENFPGKTSRLAPVSDQGGERIIEDRKGMFSVFMHIFLHCLSSQNYTAKSESRLST